ncbi:MAG: hypothetical protein KatS3mg105_2850 [Gemmatales bacterium]|nr:MAG: hypothetical protein KatS3mg105_2850 [Gemmatales bacterium]
MFSKRLLLVCAALLLSAAHSSADLKIATFNCEWLVRSHLYMKYDIKQEEWVKLPKEDREKKWEAARSAVANVIKDIDADVLALCEVGTISDVQALRERIADLGGRRYPHFWVSKTSGPLKVAIFSTLPFQSRSSEIPGTEWYDEELDANSDERQATVTRGLSVAIDYRGERLHLFACHLKSQLGGHSADAQRLAQASIVRRNYLPLLNAGKHVIVLGDLNAHRQSAVLRRIRGRDDIFADLIQTGRPPVYRPRSSERVFFKDLTRRWTYEYEGTRQQLDHILISESMLEKFEPIRADTLEVKHAIAGTKIPASDHRPLFIVLK